MIGASTQCHIDYQGGAGGAPSINLTTEDLIFCEGYMISNCLLWLCSLAALPGVSIW